MTRNEFIVEFVLNSAADRENFLRTPQSILQQAIKTADLLEEQQYATWVPPPRNEESKS